MTIVLYDEKQASPPCMAVKMTLRHLGIKVDIKIVDLFTGEHLTPEYLKINPQHMVPTIIDDGFILWESRAIQAYLVNKYSPGNLLYPQDPKERAVVDKLLYFDIGILYQTETDYLYPIHFEDQMPDEVKKDAFDKALGLLDGFLSQTPYVAGNHLTIADISILASLSFGIYFDYTFDAFRKVTAWVNKMKSEVIDYKDIVETPVTKFRQMMMSTQ